MGKKISQLLFVFCVSLNASVALAWGPRGHATICEAAVFLVQNEELSELLKAHPNMMTHVCNIPDALWKSKGGDAVSVGSPTHYMDPEIIGIAIRDFPLDYLKLQEQYEGKADQTRPDHKIFSLAKEMGSLWWRADQFYRRSLDFGRQAAASTPPSNRKEEQQKDLPFNKAVYDMLVSMGLLGHFVGDASQPFHSTADHDGYAQNHGGIHAYYEEDMVAGQDEKLMSDVVAKARKLFGELINPKKKKSAPVKNSRNDRFKAKMSETQFLLAPTVLEKMRALSAISADEVGTVLQHDPVTEKSSLRLENGMEIRTPAKRKMKSDTLKNYRPVLVQEMARSAALLAQLWDDIYDKAGEPKLGEYKSYAFPFEVDFIPPDYMTPPSKK